MAEAQKKSFFAKVKQWLGLGTVKVNMNMDNNTLTPNTTELPGTVTVEGKGDCHINDIQIVCREYWTQKGVSGGEAKKTFELGSITLNKAFDIKKGETKTFSFALPIHYVKSTEDQLIEKGGMMGAIGKLSAGLRQQSEITVCATADVEGAALDPNKILHLNFKR